ncbi:zinc finger CCCH domain-containing protein 7A-like [Ptychodera flava]|uniref:zinc finger CCCH domain-containing protein 7A-like n=1 Tax=Ptychodera flava TaxID=63121 RepID=UPI003969CFDB
MEGLAKILKQKPVRRDSIDLSKPKPPQSGDTPITTPLDLARFKRNEFYCDYCNKRCNSRIQLQQHFTSMSHQMKVMSDKDREHDWNHRPPPWNVHEDNLKMCARESKQPNACPYGECTDAHSQDELDEWKERAEYRRLKRNLAKERHLFSFMDTLIEKYSNQRSGERVLSENLEHVDIQCDSDLVIPLEKDDNKTIQQWRFKLSSDTPSTFSSA